MAHQWFGDLVTMEWWDDIWLNEGFANWMETKPLKAWNPDWHSELDEVSANQEALRLDALTSTRPVRSKANTPAEINELFDAIAYNKGAAVLRMVEAYVDAEPFRAGVNAYLEQFKYGNARAEDFWTVMTKTTGKPVDKVMSGFVDQPGAPLVSVALRCAQGKGAVAMRQERYRQLTQPAPRTPPLWNIPTCIRVPDRSSQCEPPPPRRARCRWRRHARRGSSATPTASATTGSIPGADDLRNRIQYPDACRRTHIAPGRRVALCAPANTTSRPTSTSRRRSRVNVTRW
jgi:aminopeptidase N